MRGRSGGVCSILLCIAELAKVGIIILLVNNYNPFHTLHFFTGCIIEMNVGYPSNDIASQMVENQQECADHCAFLHSSGLLAFFWEFHTDTKICWIKNSNAGRVAQQNRVSGNRYCGEAP